MNEAGTGPSVEDETVASLQYPIGKGMAQGYGIDAATQFP